MPQKNNVTAEHIASVGPRGGGILWFIWIHWWKRKLLVYFKNRAQWRIFRRYGKKSAGT